MKQTFLPSNSFVATRALPAILMSLALGTSAAHADWKVSANAIQSVYLKGVPHTDRNGKPMLQYDAARSFLPIALFNALDGPVGGETYRLAELKKAGFNSAFARSGSKPVAMAKSAVDAGLQMVFWNPKADEVKALAGNSALLGYCLDYQPIRQLKNDLDTRFAKILERRDAIRAVDKTHPVFLIDANHTASPATEWWVKLNTWGDISSHANYAISSRQTSLANPEGIPETVALAASSNKEQKPVWFVTQTFERLDPKEQATFPSVTQQRSMVYTALIYGATGIVNYMLDSAVSRGNGIIGISPAPKPQYATGITATSNQLRQSRNVWNATVALNAELDQLRPALLSPTANVPYEIALDDGWKPITENPIRALLKVNPAGGYVLLLSNIDGAPQLVRVRFPDKKDYTLTELFNAPDASQFARKEDAFEFLAAPYDVRVFQIDLK
jgi:hypothetical protein